MKEIFSDEFFGRPVKDMANEFFDSLKEAKEHG
jgi:hypothetical protein